jgi:hypothetical protein
MDDHIKSNPSKNVEKDKTADCMQNAQNQTVIPHRHVDMTAMIRSLQRTEGMVDCFRRGLSDCDQLDCAWRQYCLSKAETITPEKGS